MKETAKQVFETAVFQELKSGTGLSEGLLNVGARLLAGGEPGAVRRFYELTGFLFSKKFDHAAEQLLDVAVKVSFAPPAGWGGRHGQSGF